MKNAHVQFVLAIALAAATVSGSHEARLIAGARVARPATSEFGLGPRTSAEGRYVATLEPVAPLRTRKMQTIRLVVRSADGRAVEDAQVAIDGGMPQHGHGLPTRPRVTRHLGGGVYEIEGVRFSMGGWWVFSLAITGANGTDTVTFNLAL